MSLADLNPRRLERYGLTQGQGRRAQRLQNTAVRDWRRGGRQGERPDFANAAAYSQAMTGQGQRRGDLRRAWRAGAHTDYQAGDDLGSLLRDYRRGMYEQQEAAPTSMWRRGAPEGTRMSPVYTRPGADLNNLMDRDLWLTTIGAPHSLPENHYRTPGAYMGFDPDDVPSWLEYHIMMNSDPRFRDINQGNTL